MRDFRDAKAMAQTLRAALAAMGLKITVGQGLELVAKMFGMADWNTLLAAIRGHLDPDPESASPPAARPGSGPMRPDSPILLFSRSLETALHRAVVYANERRHEYATLEHLLLALMDEPDASAAMRACNIRLEALAAKLTSYVQHDMTALVTDEGGDALPTEAFQRVITRAVTHVKEHRQSVVTGADVLAALLDERESPAVWLLEEHGATQRAILNFALHGIVRRTFSHGHTKPAIVERVRRRAATRGQGKKPKDPG